MLRGCMNMQPPRQIQDLLIRQVKAVQSRFCFFAIRYPSDFRCNRVLNLALVGCARYTLGFRFPTKYAHQNDPLNQGNLHELKLRLKIVRCPGIEVASGLLFDLGLIQKIAAKRHTRPTASKNATG